MPTGIKLKQDRHTPTYPDPLPYTKIRTPLSAPCLHKRLYSSRLASHTQIYTPLNTPRLYKNRQLAYLLIATVG